jgi:predicted TIM-barrel fold metal-dependent hydrolase
MTNLAAYTDHVGLWRDQLRAWVPDDIFDAHVHLGPPEAMGKISEARTAEALTTFPSFTYEQCRDFYDGLFSTKRVVGRIAFGFPLREVNIAAANEYLAETARRDPTVHPFILADPHDIPATIDQFRQIEKTGVRFAGVKPYFDLLRIDKPNSVFHCRDIDFAPPELLAFMHDEQLALMQHTSSIGIGDPAVREFVELVATKYRGIKLILAHMGRYTEPRQFDDFFASPQIEHKNVFLEMSSASSASVYRQVLSRRDLWDRLLFGTDVPFGLITGVEHWSDTHGPVFLTRDNYVWSDAKMNAEFAAERRKLSYNTYHVIDALKTAMDELRLCEADERDLKDRIFRRNALTHILGAKG